MHFALQCSRSSGAVRRAQDRAKTLPWFPVLLVLEVVSSEKMQEASMLLHMVCTNRENVRVHPNQKYILFTQLLLKVYADGTAEFIPASLGIATVCEIDCKTFDLIHQPLNLTKEYQCLGPRMWHSETNGFFGVAACSILAFVSSIELFRSLPCGSLKLLNMDHLDSEWRLCSRKPDEISVNKKPKVN